MIFINPKIDFAFKKIFGSEDSKDILISFLNALIYEEKPVIQDLEILNPYLAPKIRGVKDTYLDIKAKIKDVDGSDHDVIIKMQVLNIEGIEKRILYNAAHAYSTERRLSEAHNPSNPVIALTITDFVMFSELNTVISRFILNERDFLVDHSIYDIELIFVELPKFKKQLSELKTTVDKWLFFLNETSSILEIPENMGIVPEIKKAFDMANQANFTLSELKDQQKLEISIQNQRVTIAQAIQQGVQQRTIEIARKMLNLLEDVTISQITGLSINELEAFKASNL
ncbi:MAG: Rpn family recombination-promoting nuclease/putative transposase [Pseudanabaena sp. M57BS1SP1A06MG]|jgi:predicted transposase/invertase (TIGR01784 family)|nr:Rpn family recombination-promoting nuclease/putative transposase [Pseudanabaena sp. M53BS1SP1A06MG]MCA6581055.1 Rpn family recombination-promoting nuclease/putative transposase [Pseudanabaena sp. M34BS1SP1A06MG]MCA6593987.1 Rpn family recombination-promoting nuclease/putative transposase [Pseudanabaena sp. M38BS1SP1A06MG]MCA6602721.1 Rpn family recombination-promoting nuclease/putative transposase [Pseudanabaena sp. M57BS1SP1A06MG]